MLRTIPTTAPIACLAVLLTVSAGCNKTKSEAEPVTTGAAAVTATSAGTGGAATAQPHQLVPLPGGTVAVLQGVKPEVFQVPLPPLLGIFPGKGVGAIRFGATVETIERLMSTPCEERSETLCGFTARAVDFHLKDGVVDEIRIHGDERKHSDKPDDTYGVFNGRFADGAALGMYAQFVKESLGEPKRVEKVENNGRFPTVERHYYDSFVLEYDTLENKNVVLAGVTLRKSDTAGTKKKPAGMSEPAGTTKPVGTSKPRP